jgi:hypothetical protein
VGNQYHITKLNDRIRMSLKGKQSEFIDLLMGLGDCFRAGFATRKGHDYVRVWSLTRGIHPMET